MTLYFAYGANMDIEAMKRRAPTAQPLGRARLPRHRFVIMAEGYASVIRDPRFAVHGMLWEVSLADIRSLDRFEGVDKGLYVKLNQPVVLEGFGAGAKRALIYVGKGNLGGKPRPGYLEDVIAAARGIGLPAAYIKEMEVLTGKPVEGPVPGVRPRFSRPGGGAVSRATDQWKWED
jgi:gamma-glutamylcyclotransferase (GGCT)/AIG2-like uncharacterized protein YtfP